MGFSLSPSVVVREFDNSGIIPAVSTTAAAFAGAFEWGPCEELYLIDSETKLVNTFGKPNNSNFEDWFSAANFLLYSDTLWAVRVVNKTDAVFANRGRNSTVANANGFLVMNDSVYNAQYADGSLATTYTTGSWIAKFPGAKGNSLKVSVCQTASGYQRTLTGNVTVAAANTAVTGVGTQFATELNVGDYVVISGEALKVASITSATALVLATASTTGAAANVAVQAKWEFYNEVDVAPGTSDFTAALGGSNDEMHIVVVDEDGLFTGQNGTVLESFRGVSKAGNAKLDDGTSNYYVNVINSQSKYIRWAGHDASLSNAGNNASLVTFTGNTRPVTNSLIGGGDGIAVGLAEKTRGYDLFKNGEAVDISLIIAGNAGTTLATYLVQSIAEVRKDCVVCLSPRRSDVVNNVGTEAVAVSSYRSASLPNSSYAFMDNNWKYMYDKYNDVFRWVPINADTAGLIANTDLVRDPWWSPAGFNRGNLKNVEKLAWQASKTDRDILYKVGVNAVCSFPNLGTVLYGDKTLLTKPSAFDRINVRRLFIVLEKAIATAAKFFLFELNDEFTQLQFRNMVEPYLRDIKGRRGIYDFRVICDSTVNTPEVIDSNQFIATIRIKPARSINFIYLNFVADRTGADFNETVGTF
jgi:phage tail sheath protein FI